MTGILPDGINGGLIIRNSLGVCTPFEEVQQAYCPPETFTSSCEISALPSDCRARITAAQMNALVSELLCLMVQWNPAGSYDCASLCNLATNFAAWAAANNPITDDAPSDGNSYARRNGAWYSGGIFTEQVTAPIFAVDASFYLDLIGTKATLVGDVNDWYEYDRSANRHNWYVGGSLRFSISENFTESAFFRASAQGGGEGGEFVFAKPPTGSTLAGDVSLDIAGNNIRIFENGGTFRGAFIDLTGTDAAVASQIWHSKNLPVDLTTTPPNIGDTLVWNGTKLVPVSPAAGARTIGERISGSFVSLPPLCLWANGQNVSRATYALLFAATTIAGTVAINSTVNATLTLADAEAVASVQPGMPIEAAGIPAGTTISARGAATATTLAVTLSAAATATAAANATRVFPNGNGNGTTTFGVADYRDRTGVGRGNMGGGSGNIRISQAVAGFNASRLGAGGGDQNNPSQALQGRYGTANGTGASWLNAVPGDQITFGSPMPGDGGTVGAGGAANVQPSIVENVAIFAGA